MKDSREARMKIQVQKIKTTYLRRAGKALLWTLIIFLIIRGIFTLFRVSDKETADALIQNYIHTTAYQKKVEYEATAFAEAFTYEYYTFNEYREDYKKRMKKYIKNNPQEGLFAKDIAKVIQAKAYQVNWISENQLDIDVHAKVEYTIMAQAENSTLQSQKVIDDIYIRIPIAEKESQYIIEDYPMMIPAQEKAEIKYSQYYTNEVSKEEKNKIKNVIENFFKAYYTGNKGEIDYYITQNSKITKGLEGRVEFIKLNSLQVFKEENTPVYTAIVNITLKDHDHQLNQHFNLNLIKDNRYYIQKINTRTINIQGGQNQ